MACFNSIERCFVRIRSADCSVVTFLNIRNSAFVAKRNYCSWSTRRHSNLCTIRRTRNSFRNTASRSSFCDKSTRRLLSSRYQANDKVAAVVLLPCDWRDVVLQI